MDTGAFSTIVDERIALDGKWEITGPIPNLEGAGNNSLNARGIAKVNIEITIGKRTKAALVLVAIVANFGLEMVIGLELLTLFRCTVDCEDEKINFKKNGNKLAILAAETTEIHPRSQTIIEANADTIGTIMSIPSSKKQGLIVANSLSNVTSNRTKLLVCNTSNKTIKLDGGEQLCRYEKYEPNNTTPNVNVALEIEGIDTKFNAGNQLDRNQTKQLCSLLSEHRDAFVTNDKIGVTDAIYHDIELVPGAQPSNTPLRRRPQPHVEETQRQLDQMIEEGIVQTSKSPWSSAYVLARKKSGEYRLCVDFRRLNNLTKKVDYPLPNTDECIESLAGNKYFSLLDLASGFWQVPLTERARELTAFKTENGLYEFNRMPFGLCNGLATFQRLVNALFTGLKGVDLQAFIDDICLASKSWKEHLELIDRVLKIIETSGLKLSCDKCIFATKKILFLGHIISEKGIEQDPEKLKALTKMPRPRDTKDVKRFLGMTSYYRKFVPNFASLAHPLNALLRKNVKFNWGQTQEKSYNEIIQTLKDNIVLSHYNSTDPVLLKTDACREGLAGMLFQKQAGEWRLITCCSRAKSDCEKRYSPTDMECLAIIYSVSKLRNYLLGRKFTILTDHSALKVLNDGMPKTDRLKRWAAILAEYEFKVEYIKGSLHQDVDCLSRAPVTLPIIMSQRDSSLSPRK